MANSVWVMITVPADDKDVAEPNSDQRTRTVTIGPLGKFNEGIYANRSSSTEERKKDQDDPHIKTVLEKTLEELDINNAVWIKSSSNRLFHVYFSCDVDDSDSIIHHIQIQGIGSLPHTFIGMVPFVLAYQAEDDADVFLDEATEKADENGKNELNRKQGGFKMMQEKFLKSVTARLTVAQVVASVQSGAELTFDFCCYILCAAWLAALGLMESDVVTLVASMLVAPLMGPIMAMAFGLIVQDRELRNLGFRNAVIGFTLSIIFGFFYGSIIFNFTDVYDPTATWPSKFMQARGQFRTIWVGGLVALPSGAAVAVSLLSGNQASLVGVAISASLLPPCVNSGLLWSYSVIKSIRALGEDYIQIDNVTFTKPSLVFDPGFQVTYSTNLSYECFWLGLGSLGLALTNVGGIMTMSWLLLKIKEVSPADDQSTARFWKEDVKIVREYNKTVKRKRSLHQDLLSEWAEMNGLDAKELLAENPEARVTQLATLKDMVKDVEEDQVFQQIVMSTRPNANWRKMSMAAMESLRYDAKQNKSSSTVSIDMDNRDLRSHRRSIALPSTSSRTFLGSLTGEPSPHNSTGAKNSISTVLQTTNQPTEPDFIQRRRQSSALLRKSLRTSDHSPYSVWPRRGSETQRFMLNPIPSGNEFDRRS